MTGRLWYGVAYQAKDLKCLAANRLVLRDLNYGSRGGMGQVDGGFIFDALVRHIAEHSGSGRHGCGRHPVRNPATQLARNAPPYFSSSMIQK